MNQEIKRKFQSFVRSDLGCRVWLFIAIVAGFLLLDGFFEPVCVATKDIILAITATVFAFFTIYFGRKSIRVIAYFIFAYGLVMIPVTAVYLCMAPRCEVHNKRLFKDRVQIVYGWLEFQEGYIKAWETEFPNANTFTWGGCVVYSPTTAKVLYCQDCRDAKRKWYKENPWTSTNGK